MEDKKLHGNKVMFMREVMEVLEQLRLEKKISIQDFTKYIVSRRNYSRFLSGEIGISLETLSKLLKNLEIPLSEFSLYLYNRNLVKRVNETHFVNYVKIKKYDKAFKYYQLIKDNLEQSFYVYTEKM